MVLYIGREAGEALRAIRPAEQLLDRNAPVFGLSAKQNGRRVQAAAQTADLGDGFIHAGQLVRTPSLHVNSRSGTPSRRP